MKTITILISLFFLLVMIFPSVSGAQEEDDYWSKIEKKNAQEEDIPVEAEVPEEEPEQTEPAPAEDDPPPESPDPEQAQGAEAQPPPPEAEPVMLPPPSTESSSPVPEITQDDGEGISYQEAFPDDFKKVQPVRIAILSSSARSAAGQQIGMILGNFQKKRLEKALGRKVMIAYVSRSTKKHGENTIIRYRPDFLKAAIQVAAVLPKNQVVEAMQLADLALHEVDVVVYVGSKIR